MALRDLFTRQIPGEPKTPVVGRTPAFPPPRDSIIVNPEVSMSVAAVYRSVAILSTLIRQMPIQVLRDNEQIDSKIGDRPDIEVPRQEFMEQTAKSLLLHGNAYWLASRDTTGQVMNLTVIRPSSIAVTDANAGTSPIPRATYHIGGTDVTRDIYHARLNTNPGEVVGYGPLQSCPLDVQAIIKLRNYSDAFFEIGSPVGVLSSDQFLNQEQADEMRERWHEVMRERTIAVLGNGLEYKSVWTDPKQAQFVENVQAAVTNIARLFGIPTMLLASGIAASLVAGRPAGQLPGKAGAVADLDRRLSTLNPTETLELWRFHQSAPDFMVGIAKKTHSMRKTRRTYTFTAWTIGLVGIAVGITCIALSLRSEKPRHIS